MKKRTFLTKTAILASTLLSGAAMADLTTTGTPATNQEANVQYVQGTSQLNAEFVIAPVQTNNAESVVSGHASHASHASHSSGAL